MRYARTAIIAVALVAACHAVAMAAPQTDDQATAEVSLTIEKYVFVDIRKDSLDMVVTPDMITYAGAWKAKADSYVDLDVNFDAIVKCPKKINLVDGGVYEVDADISLIGVGTEIPDPTHWLLEIDPGHYNGPSASDGTLQIETSIEKDWDMTDPADTYTGTVTLQVYEQT